MVTYKILKQQNKDYNPDLLNRLCLLYKGGYDVTNNADLFLHQLAAETPPSFEDRKKCCSYLPFMSDIIDHYSALLFSQELSISEAGDAEDTSTLGNQSDDESVYKLFLAAADGEGNSFEEVMRKVMTDALIHKDSFIGIDFPVAEEVPVNLLEEEVMQTGRPYIYYLDPECVIDWLCDDNGNFIWIKIYSDNIIQPDPLSPPKHQLDFKIWTMKNGVAHWQQYKTKELDLKKFPSTNDDIPLFDEGNTSFTQIPILKLSLPVGLALGNKIAPICEDIYQRTSILVNGENKSLNAIRVVFLGDEAPPPGQGMPSMVQENPFRHLMIQNDWEAKGIAVLGANDKMEVVESEGHAFSIVADQIDKLIEKLKEVTHQMANSAAAHTKSLGRSASSKQEDRHSTEVILSAYGNIVRDFTKRVMACISSARDEKIVWTVNGLDDFNITDRNQLMLEAQQFPNIIATSISETFTKLYTEKFYLGILESPSHEEALQIRDEIMKGAASLPQLMQNQLSKHQEPDGDESTDNTSKLNK